MPAYLKSGYGCRPGKPNLTLKGRTIEQVPVTETQTQVLNYLNKYPGNKVPFYGKLAGLPRALGTSWANAALRGLARRGLAHRTVAGLWYPGPESSEITD